MQIPFCGDFTPDVAKWHVMEAFKIAKLIILNVVCMVRSLFLQAKKVPIQRYPGPSC
jgi:hypothetical protein